MNNFSPDLAEVKKTLPTTKPGEVDIGGGYKIDLNLYSPPDAIPSFKQIIDKEGNRQIGIGDYKESFFDGKKLFIAKAVDTNQDFSAATLPKSRLLIVGDRLMTLIKSPEESQKKGYRHQEAENMIIGHELTHIRYGQLPESEVQGIVDFYAASWGSVHNFATNLMSREEYRKKVLSGTAKEKARNPNIKTRQVVVDGKKYEVSVSEIINELLAFRTAAGLIGENRIRELAKINPTQQDQSRESLSVIAHDTLKQIKSSKKSSTLPGEELYSGLRGAIDTIKEEISQLQ